MTRSSFLSALFALLFCAAFCLILLVGVVPPMWTAALVFAGKFDFISSSPLPGWLGSLLSALEFSAAQAFFSASFSVGFAVLLGRSAFLHPGRISRLFLSISQVPFGLPGVVVVLGFILTYGNNGFINEALSPFGLSIPFLYNFWAIVMAHTYFNLGMCANQISQDYERIPAGYWYGAQTMGLRQWKRFISVEWPHIRYSVLNLWMLVFCLSLTSFAIVLILGGSPHLATLEVLIYQFVRYELDFKSAIGAAALQFAFLCLVGGLSLWLHKYGYRSHNLAPSSPRLKNTIHFRAGRGIWSRLSLMVGALWCLGPLLMVAIHAGNSIQALASQDFRLELLNSFFQSLQLGIPVAFLSTTTGLLLAQGAARMRNSSHGLKRNTFYGAAIELSNLGLLALSPSILAFSWYAVMAALGIGVFDHAMLIVIFVQTFLLSPLAFRLLITEVEAEFNNQRLQYQALGLPIGLQALVIETLSIRARLWSVLLLMFSFSMGEVAAPAMFGTPEFRPLAFFLLECLSSYEFHKAGIITLILLLLTQLTFYAGQRGKRHA